MLQSVCFCWLTGSDITNCRSSPVVKLWSNYGNKDVFKLNTNCEFFTCPLLTQELISCHQPINFQRSVCQPKQVLRLYLVNLNVVSHALLSSTLITHLVLLLLPSVSNKIFCPTYPHSVMIWHWWVTAIFILIPHHLISDSYLVFWSLSISINTLSFLLTFVVLLLILWFVLQDAMFSLYQLLILFWTTFLLLTCEFHPTIVGLSHKSSSKICNRSTLMPDIKNSELIRYSKNQYNWTGSTLWQCPPHSHQSSCWLPKDLPKPPNQWMTPDIFTSKRHRRCLA